MDGSHDVRNAKLRALPQVSRLLQTTEAEALHQRFGGDALVTALRAVLGDARRAILEGADPRPVPDLLQAASDALERDQRPVLRRVINATGVLLHTNLGRAPLAPEAVTAIIAASGYCTLEFDAESGERGSRLAGVEHRLCSLTGAEAALAVNNGAAAVLLALSAHAAGGEVIVSRGELVEIGGGFRIPEVIAQGGARLVEVGTTNKTRLADYEAAITPSTRLLLKVHQSNYRIVGFTEAVEVDALAALARARGLLVMDDLGSGTLAALRTFREPTAGEAVCAGADLVAFSGDKLLGGPQAGILVGTEVAIAPLRRHPLLRALRLDKLTLAALEATLILHAVGEPERVPLLRMLAQGPGAIRARADRILGLLGTSGEARIVPTIARVGGGALPTEQLASFALRFPEPGLAGILRRGDPAVVGRLEAGHFLLDLAAVADTDLELLAERVHAAL